MIELYVKTLFALVFVVIILYVFLKLLQKYSNLGNKNFIGSKDNNIEMNSILYLDSESKIVNFSCKNKKYLVLITKNNSLLIDSYEDK